MIILGYISLFAAGWNIGATINHKNWKRLCAACILIIVGMTLTRGN